MGERLFHSGMAHAHHHHHTLHVEDLGQIPPHLARLMRLASYASVGIASILVIAKLVVWWISDSLAIFSSLTDSLFDVLVSVMNMIALRYALKPADNEHRFGHTAIEDIVGLAQFAFITASMIIIILQSTERLFNPVPLEHEMLGIAVSTASMMLTGILVAFQGYVARKTNSLIVASDRLHYLGDVLFNLGVIVALALSLYLGWLWADPVIAIIIALAIMISTLEIGTRAFNNLMGREMPDAEKERLRSAVAGVAGVLGYHKLRTRYMGTKPIIQLHIDLDEHISFADAHRITDAVEAAILQTWPNADVIVHGDPGAHTHTHA